MTRRKKKDAARDNDLYVDPPTADDAVDPEAVDEGDQDDETEALASAAAESGIEAPDTETADVFVAIHLRNEILIRSAEIVLEPTFTAFWNVASEWAWMDVRCWCDERDLNAGETDTLIDSITPDLFHVDLKSGRLSPVRDDLYRKVKGRRDRTARQFAFLDIDAPFEKVASLLHARLVDAHGSRATPKSLRLARPVSAST